MDIMTIIGLIAGLATVVYVMQAGDIFHLLFNQLAFILVFGGTFSATLISYPWDVLKRLPGALKLMFTGRKYTDGYMQATIDRLATLAEKARLQGQSSLQAEALAERDRFMAYGLQMLVDGLDESSMEENMEKRLAISYQHSARISSAFRTMATLSPIFGLLGTLIGVVQVLRNLSDPSDMGSAMAIAITTTFYGIFAANFIFLPAAIKLGDLTEDEVLFRRLLKEGIIAIRQGSLPVIVRKRLNAFIVHKLGPGNPEKEG